MDGCNAYEWHSKYSLGTKYFGKVESGTECWKYQDIQAVVAAAYSAKKSETRRAASVKAGTLYKDDDFKTCKLGEYCTGPIILDSDRDKAATIQNLQDLEWEVGEV